MHFGIGEVCLSADVRNLQPRIRRGTGRGGNPMLPLPPTLSVTDARRAAVALLDRCGDVAMAAAVLRAQEAEASGRYLEMSNWRSIAEAAFEFSQYSEASRGRLPPVADRLPGPSRPPVIAPRSPLGSDDGK
jgi:hypothetical protein